MAFKEFEGADACQLVSFVNGPLTHYDNHSKYYLNIYLMGSTPPRPIVVLSLSDFIIMLVGIAWEMVWWPTVISQPMGWSYTI